MAEILGHYKLFATLSLSQALANNYTFFKSRAPAQKYTLPSAKLLTLGSPKASFHCTR